MESQWVGDCQSQYCEEKEGANIPPVSLNESPTQVAKRLAQAFGPGRPERASSQGLYDRQYSTSLGRNAEVIGNLRASVTFRFHPSRGEAPRGYGMDSPIMLSTG